MVTTGCRVSGLSLPPREFSGRPAIGASRAAGTSGTKGIGAARVGFYGGVNYGNGYFGSGFTGGRWDGRVFRHNTAISNVDVHNVHNTYVDHTVVREVRGPNHAFNGRRGIQAQPSRDEMEASRAPHQGPTPVQVSHAQEAHNSHLAAHGAAHR